MYCKRCGNEIGVGMNYCSRCGYHQNVGPAGPGIYDSGSLGWAILAFILPPLGLILWILWVKERPKSAEMLLIGSIISILAFASFTLVPLIIGPIVGSLT